MVLWCQSFIEKMGSRARLKKERKWFLSFSNIQFLRWHCTTVVSLKDKFNSLMIRFLRFSEDNFHQVTSLTKERLSSEKVQTEFTVKQTLKGTSVAKSMFHIATSVNELLYIFITRSFCYQEPANCVGRCSRGFKIFLLRILWKIKQGYRASR